MTIRKYHIHQTVNVSGEGEQVELWIPLPLRSHYQKVSNLKFSSGEVHSESTFSASWIYSKFETCEISFDLEVQSRSGGDFQKLSAEERLRFLKSNSRVPLDGIVRETSMKITETYSRDRDRAQAIYDWVIDHSERDPNQIGCGTGDVKGTLDAGHICGRCVDISSVVSALMRGAGIPCREVFGLRVGPSEISASFGKAGDISGGQHCRNEFYLEGEGWVPCDPGDVTKLQLEENLKRDSQRFLEIKQKLSSYWEPNWMAYNYARDFELTPSTGIRENYLMYPIAMILGERSNPYVPATFKYQIASKT